ncbi:hypothetical protein Hsero_1203 [Herbaspirillum seropedicae SmR1]|uniref:Uncharacterized protein n=1 Tax=Herbaspirillum seropedicae (strain SmR1) TaxID=757424 RepID=D8J1U9_HERSS|nr:hypothetical protein Hsero_1203 [Herbaspirillum seropedicae SmR1]
MQPVCTSKGKRNSDTWTWPRASAPGPCTMPYWCTVQADGTRQAPRRRSIVISRSLRSDRA